MFPAQMYIIDCISVFCSVFLKLFFSLLRFLSSLIFTKFSVKIVNILCQSKFIRILPSALSLAHLLGDISLKSLHLSAPVWTGCSPVVILGLAYSIPLVGACVFCVWYSDFHLAAMPSLCTSCASFYSF